MMGKAMDVGKMQQNMQKFEQTNMKMQLQQSMMGDAFDALYDDDEEELDDILEQLDDELAADLTTKLNKAGVTTNKQQAQQQKEEEEDAEMKKMLAQLGI